MIKITDSLKKFYTETKNYIRSKDWKHSDAIIGGVTLNALGVTALLGGIAAGKQYPKLAVSATLGGVAGTVLYGLHQLYLRQFIINPIIYNEPPFGAGDVSDTR